MSKVDLEALKIVEEYLSNLSEENLKNIFNMPGDPNYQWSEDDGIQSSKIFDFKKIKGIKYSDPRVNKISFSGISDYFQFDDINEAKLEADYDFAYLVYKYIKIHNNIPNWIYITNDALSNNFFENFILKLKIPENSYLATYRNNNKLTELSGLWANLDRLFIFYDGNGAYIIFPPDQKNFRERENELGILFGIIKAYKKPTVAKNKIYVIYRTQNGFDKKDFTLHKIKNINLEDNYNDGFPEVSNDIITKLNSKKSGLVILPGIPGTGKTTYIRYLATKLKRNIIFIPPDMVHHITEPDFIPFLMNNSDAILIIEDAESAIKKRDLDGRTGAVSNILNLTDGLLSDCLNISIVVTFNTETKNIDEALLRKGRLLKMYRFEKLALEKTKLLMTKQKHDISDVKSGMTLSEIYFFEDVVNGNPESSLEQKRIGFGN